MFKYVSLTLCSLVVVLVWVVITRVGSPSLSPIVKISEFSESRPGIALRLAVQGEEVVITTKGLARSDPKTPINPNTNFNIASLAKQFTAYAVLLLESDGKLDRNQSLRSLVPELPAWASNVSLHNLLMHSGGIPEIIWPCILPIRTENAQIISYLLDTSALETTPGAMFRYSNTGYALLAITVERASGMKFHEFLETRIFQPLAMTNTFVYSSKRAASITNRADGFNSWPLDFAFPLLSALTSWAIAASTRTLSTTRNGCAR